MTPTRVDTPLGRGTHLGHRSVDKVTYEVVQLDTREKVLLPGRMVSGPRPAFCSWHPKT